MLYRFSYTRTLWNMLQCIKKRNAVHYVTYKWALLSILRCIMEHVAVHYGTWCGVLCKL